MDAEWAMPDFDDMLALSDAPELPVSQSAELGSLSLERLLSTGRDSGLGGIMADDDLSTHAIKVELSEIVSMPVSELTNAPEKSLFKLEEPQPSSGISPSACLMTPPSESSMLATESSVTPEPPAALGTSSKRTRRPLGAPRRPLGAPRRPSSPSPSAESQSKRVKSEPPVHEPSPSPSPSAAPRDPGDKEQYIKEKNRDAARLFRQRRKDYLRNLEDELRRSQDRQVALEARARELEVANAALRTNAQSATERLERQEQELQRLRSAAAALSSGGATAAGAATPASSASTECTAGGSITIPPMSELKESLDVRQLAQVVVCLMIIANIVGPIAGWDMPAVTEALPAAADVVLSAGGARKPNSKEARASAPSASAAASEAPSAAPAPAAINIVGGGSVAQPPAPSSIDLNSAPAQLISSYLTAMDPTVLAYLVVSAHKARAAGGLEAVAAASR